MLTSPTIVICLSTLAAAPPAATRSAPLAEEHPVVHVGEHGPSAEGCSCQHCGNHGCYKGPLGDWLCPRCDMSQRVPYYPTNHGHYYFRPYHMQRVLEQQGQAVSWGEDARNPYGHLVFDRVYEELRREQGQVETLPPQKMQPMIEVKPKAPESDKRLPEPAPQLPPGARQSSKKPFRYNR